MLDERGRQVLEEPWPADGSGCVPPSSGPAPTVLVVDGWQPAAGLRGLADAIADQPRLRVLVVGPLDPRLEVLVALAVGISGYLPDESSAADVADAVAALCAGQVVVVGVDVLPVAWLRPGERGIAVGVPGGATVKLTHREWDVLVLLRQGYSTAGIASRLLVSRPTVRTHVAALVRKLPVRDRAGLAGPLLVAPER